MRRAALSRVPIRFQRKWLAIFSWSESVLVPENKCFVRKNPLRVSSNNNTISMLLVRTPQSAGAEPRELKSKSRK
jgi:hypothetical protein